MIDSDFDVEVTTNSFNAMMNGIAQIFRSILLVGGYTAWSTSCNDNSFLKSFTAIAGYSSKPEHSKTLTRLMLKGMSVTILYRIRRELSARLDTMTNMSDELLRTSTTNALGWVRGIETPDCLKHIARHTIILALSGRDLPTAEILCIPKQLEYYLGFKENSLL